jgi:hypothetical protein
VFDHRHAGRALEHPRREDLAPAASIITLAFDQHLHEGTGFLRHFPRRGPLAGRNADDDVADTARFARLHDQILADIVALVEQTDGGDPLDHRSCAFDRRSDPGGIAGLQFLRHFSGNRLWLGRRAITCSERQCANQDR